MAENMDRTALDMHVETATWSEDHAEREAARTQCVLAVGKLLTEVERIGEERDYYRKQVTAAELVLNLGSDCGDPGVAKCATDLWNERDALKAALAAANKKCADAVARAERAENKLERDVRHGGVDHEHRRSDLPAVR